MSTDAPSGFVAELWRQSSCLGSPFFGGVLGNLAASLVWEAGKWVARPVINRVPELAELLSRGGQDGNHHLLRALRHAECVVLVEMVDRAMLQSAGLRLGQGQVAEMLRIWVKAHGDGDIGTLLRIRRAFQRAAAALIQMSLTELVRLNGAALSDVPGLIRAGSECLSASSTGDMRERVTADYVQALDTALSRPARFGALSTTDLAPLAPAGLPGVLRTQLEMHPGGWWDALRLAFREELKNPANEAARVAWELDVQCHLTDQLGASYTDLSGRLDAIDANGQRSWQAWADFRLTFDAIAEDLADLLGRVSGIQQGVERIEAKVDSGVEGLQRSMDLLLARFGTSALQELEALRSEHATTLEEVSALVRIILELPDLPADQVRPALEKSFGAYRELRTELDALRERLRDEPDIQEELDLAAAALDTGSPVDLVQAEKALEAARERFRAAIKIRRLREADLEYQLAAKQALLAAARLRFLEAAALWKEAADCLLPGMEALRVTALCNEGLRRYEHCELFGGTQGCRDAVQCFDHALTLLAPSTTSVDWAATQNNRAIALRVLGERVGGGDGLQALRAAIAGYDAALGIRTREAVPVDWAATQNNRAIALQVLGERVGGDEGLQVLHEAIAGYDATLGIHTREALPVDWAMTQNNRAVAVQWLGTRVGGDEGLQALHDAIAGYDAALGIRTREAMPAEWAITQQNRAAALQVLGERMGSNEGLQALRAAIAGYDAALGIRTREAMPPHWAVTQNNRGIALCALGERVGGDEGLQALRAAIAGYDAALGIRTREAMPADWAATQNNRAIALQVLGERVGDEGLQALHDAIAGYDAALRIHTREAMPADWAGTQHNRATALQALGALVGGAEGLRMLRDAIAGYDAALGIRTRETMPVDWAMTQNNRANALQWLGARVAGNEELLALRAAIAGYDAVLGIRTREAMPVDWAATQHNRAIALQWLGARVGGDEGLQALRAAIAGYDAALGIRTREAMPAHWAATQNNRANTLRALGAREGGDEGLQALRAAITGYDAALGIHTREALPVDWAMTLRSRATALGMLGERVGGAQGVQALREAIIGCDAALEFYTRESMPDDRAATQETRAIALSVLHSLQGGDSP